MRGQPVTLRDRVHFAGLRACNQLSPARPHGVPLHHCGQVLLIPHLLLRYLSFGNVLPMQERDGGGEESRALDESLFPCSCFGDTHEAEKQWEYIRVCEFLRVMMRWQRCTWVASNASASASWQVFALATTEESLSQFVDVWRYRYRYKKNGGGNFGNPRDDVHANRFPGVRYRHEHTLAPQISGCYDSTGY